MKRRTYVRKNKLISIILVFVFLVLLSLILLKIYHHAKQQELAATTTAATAVTTYQSIGLYWSPADGSSTNQCNVQYRVQGTTAWKQALPLWYDGRALGGRPAEYRGSIVLLQPGTTYEIQLTLASGTTTTLTANTWTDTIALPIAQTVTVPSGNSYAITNGGSATGYILYTGPATITGTADSLVTVNASYVIVKGLTLKGGATNGILLGSNVHDVIIQNNDISGWGHACNPVGFCGEEDSAVRATSDVNRITVERNKMHDPVVNSNNYCEKSSSSDNHPTGGRSVGFEGAPSNIVIRYNEQWGDINHMFEDGMGANNNHSYTGFPNKDSDIYGNIVQDTIDDAIETEGADMNIRVWGNYINRAFTGPSTAAISIGPEYIFRNVMARTDKCAKEDGGYGTNGERGPFDKGGDSGGFGGGKRYLLNNTTLQIGGKTGPNLGPADYGGTITNTVSENNNWHTNGNCYSVGSGANNVLDYDLCPSGATGTHSINAAPIYAPSNGDLSDANGPIGMYQLASNSPGYHKGLSIPNFTDDMGPQPDMGAQQSGSPKMEFGVSAYLTGTPNPTTPAISGTPQPTTPQGGGTSVSVTVCPHGIGQCGDNANPNSSSTLSPQHTQRTITVTLLNGSGQTVATQQGTVNFDSPSGSFKGTIPLGSVASGNYLVTIKGDGYLSKQTTGIVAITANQANTLSPVSLTTGDINNDNQLDILDYNLLISCFGSKQTTATCTTPPTQTSPGADLTDDTKVDGADYNLFLRELSVQKGV